MSQEFIGALLFLEQLKGIVPNCAIFLNNDSIYTFSLKSHDVSC